jgi:hypothetical protein
VFCQATRWIEASPEQRAVLLARAVVLARRDGPPCAVSHASAAALHGLPVPLRLAETCWLTLAAGHGGRTHYDPVLRQEVAALPPRDVRAVGGLLVTSLARTVADCLRHLPPDDAVAVADAALRRGLALELLARTIKEQESWPLAAAARAALPLLDGRRESALESRSAVVMHRFEIPPPLTQVEIYDRRGRLVGRADFLWPGQGVVGEADGRGKYVGGEGMRAFDDEKDRQAELEELGLVVVRWDSRHLLGDPPPAVVRIRSALRRSPRSRFTGSLRQVPPPTTYSL